MFDDEVVKEVADFERIKRIEMKSQLGGLADAHIEFYGEVASIWEKYVQEMEKEGIVSA
ncbi:intercellular trafficking and secretion [Fusarium oxysporum]|nr:intercellular trafficking and secretion [Fusarium oxysporum]